MRASLGLLAIAGSMACAGQVPMTDAQRAAITDSVKAVQQSVFAGVNQKDATAAFAAYSSDGSSKYTENGETFPNLDALRKANGDLLQTLETVQLTPSSMDVTVLSPEVAVVTTSFTATLKPPGKPEYKTPGVISSVVQRRDGKWQIVSTHESEPDAPGFGKAMAPAPVKAKPAAKTPAKAPAKTAPKKK